jgi:hypothetical protein
MRGSETLARRTGRRSELAQIDVLLYLVENGAARSALELSQAIYGEGQPSCACNKILCGSSAPMRSSAEVQEA